MWWLAPATQAYAHRNLKSLKGSTFQKERCVTLANTKIQPRITHRSDRHPDSGRVLPDLKEFVRLGTLPSNCSIIN